MITWTEELIAKLEDLWKNSELSAREIAKEMGISANSISGKCSRMWGPHARSKVAYAKPHAPWTKESVDILVSMIKIGYSNVEIGEAVGKSRNAVKHKLKFMGLQRPRGAPARRSVKYAAPSPAQLSACWEAIPGTEPIHLSRLGPFHCPWPLWTDVPNFMYCGRAKQDKQNYCPHHCAIGTKPRESGYTL